MITDSKTKILDSAQRLVQTQGYAGFSFGDIKDEVGITTASIHYHFPTKAELGVALVRRFRDGLRGALAKIAQSHEPFATKIGGVITLYDQVRVQNCTCFGSALGGEYGALPDDVRTELRAFIDDSIAGLKKIIEPSQKRGEIRADVSAEALARTWYALLQGALTASRASDPVFLAQATQTLLKLTQTA
jgi:TetR/AcrR family transcriptional repressor of nem operon